MSLGKLTVNGRQDGFLCEGKPFFWFADTCWSAFTSITEADWDYYLTRRAEQGMNVLQINTLPQWDRCCPDLGIWPYASEDGVHFDWSAPNQEYWDRARRMCQAAVEHGIRPALVLMWCNYVPGTWGSVIAERLGAEVMPREEVRAHVARVVENLGEFDPVYVVTGDTDFKTDEAIAYYGDALDEVTKLAPESLHTMHINRGNRALPEQFADRLDFYMFQPGHNYSGQEEAWKLPEDFARSIPKSRWSIPSPATSKWARAATCTGVLPRRIVARVFGRAFWPVPVPALPTVRTACGTGRRRAVRAPSWARVLTCRSAGKSACSLRACGTLA